MHNATRAFAIYTGAVASVCLVVSVIWWVDPSFGNRSGSAVLVVAFLSGLLCFFVWFVMFLVRAPGFRGSEVPGLIWKNWQTTPLLLRVWFALVLAAAVVSFGVALSREGKWEAAAPYSDAPAGCHWPLYGDHDTAHLCVSHTRWLDVSLETAHIFVGFGVIFLISDCAAFTLLSRYPERPLKTPAAPGSGQPPYWPPPPGWHPEA